MAKGADKDAKSGVSDCGPVCPCKSIMCMALTVGVCSPPEAIPPETCASLQNGDTPLILAAQEGHIEIATLLLENSADKDAKNNVSHYQPCPRKCE